ncbi:MAG: ribonuclease domain-containing protein [Nitrospiraceae bacterium]
MRHSNKGGTGSQWNYMAGTAGVVEIPLVACYRFPVSPRCPQSESMRMRHALTAIRLVILAGLVVLSGVAVGIAFAQAVEGVTPSAPSVGDQRVPPPLDETDPKPSPGGEQPADHGFLKEPPPKAHAVLEAIQKRHGEPLPGYVGGRFFHNRERRLPPGRYREYDVNPKVSGRNRGAERLVIEQRTGKAYYTDDHYRTFTPMN